MFIWRLVANKYCSLKELQDGTYSFDDLMKLNDTIDFEAEINSVREEK